MPASMPSSMAMKSSVPSTVRSNAAASAPRSPAAISAAVRHSGRSNAARRFARSRTKLRSAGVANRIETWVLVIDVVIEKLLKGRGELVVRAAERGRMKAIDIHRTVRRLAGAGQRDADVGGFGFARPVDDAAHDRER